MNFNFNMQPGKRLIDRGMVKTEKPLVSIITPFYNSGKYFEQTYNCVLNQTFPFFEWVIANDGSTNQEDVELIERLAALDPRIRVIHKENGGISTARNFAIKNAVTDIIITLDADDLIEPAYIEELYWVLHYNPEASVCYTNTVGFQNQEYLWDRHFDVNLLKTYNFLTYSAAFRKSAMLEVGLYDEIAKHYYEDWRMWLKLFSAGKKPVKIASYDFWYRRLDTGVLSIVQKDPETRKLAEKLIEEAAETVNTTIEATEYPRTEGVNRYDMPRVSEWDKTFFQNKQKLHILMILPWLVLGGADKFNLDVVKGFDRGKFDVGIITTLPSENDWQQFFKEHTSDIFNLPDFLDIRDWAEFISYYIKSRQVDIIFLSQSEYGYFLLPWIQREFPEVLIVDYIHITEWNYKNGGFTMLSGQMKSLLEKTFVCNNVTRMDLIDVFGRKPESIETLYIGVDNIRFNPEKIEPGYIYKKLNINKDRPIVLFPCRLAPQKRPFLMLEIANELKKYIKNVALVVVGDGYQLNDIKIKASQKKLDDTVFFAGRTDNIESFYKDTKVTLICSIKEGLSLTAYESLSMGVPVISADVGGQAELVDSATGRLIPLMQDEVADYDARDFKTEEINMYVQTLMEILSDDKKRTDLGEAGRKRIESAFSISVMLAKLQSALHELYTQKKNKKKQDIDRNEELSKVVSMLHNELYLRDNSHRVMSVNISNDNNDNNDMKSELIRIANSRFGNFIIKIIMKLRLNKLFK